MFSGLHFLETFLSSTLRHVDQNTDWGSGKLEFAQAEELKPGLLLS